MAFASSAETAPLGEMNMTPLIDVLLVLLIMFVITIPLAAHSTDIDVGATTDRFDFDPVVNKVVVTESGTVLWNGQPASQAELEANLVLASRIAPEPELQFEPDGSASYQLSALTLRTIKASPVTKFGFVGNDRYREFGVQ